MNYGRRVIVLIILLSALRLLVSSLLDLGNDESYYWAYSQHLQWNYFDHPPMVAIWIRVFTINLKLQEHVEFLRLGGIAGCAISTWFMFRCVTELVNEKAGWYAACLYNASFYAGITAGIFIMPDTPEMVFWTFSMWMIIKICRDDSRWIPWILFGIGSGLCIMSKVHGVFLWAGLGLYILFVKREWLRNPRLYCAVILTALIISPILIWNINNDFVTFRFHSERVGANGSGIQWYGLLHEGIGQFLINNPVNVAIMFIALVFQRKSMLRKRDALTIFKLISIPLILAILLIAISRQTLPHWSGPAYIALVPVASAWLAVRKKYKVWLQWHNISLGAYILFLITCTATILFYPGTFGLKSEANLGHGDLTLDNFGWKRAGKQFTELYQNDIRNGVVEIGTPVVCNKWWGAHLEYNFCLPSGVTMIGLGPINELHQYLWLNGLRKNKVNFNSAYCIVPSLDRYDAKEKFGDYYDSIDSLSVIRIFRNDQHVMDFFIYRLHGWKRNLPTVEGALQRHPDIRGAY